jgi:hypothetical protein
MRLPPRLLHDIKVKTVIGKMLRDIEDDPAVISDAEIERQAVREVIDAERQRQAANKAASSAPPVKTTAPVDAAVAADAAFVVQGLLRDYEPPSLPERAATAVKSWASALSPRPARARRPARPRPEPTPPPAPPPAPPPPLLLLVGGSDVRRGQNINHEFTGPRWFDSATETWRAQNRDRS